MVLAYGSWATIAGRPGQPSNRGHPPCIGKKLRSKLAHHFIVASTPEAWTSQTCSKCLSRCGPCAEVDARCSERRTYVSAERDAGTIPPSTRLPPRSCRGLRRCCSAECGVFLNRDHNAAMNIGLRCSEMIFGQRTDLSLSSFAPSDMDAIDEVLESLRATYDDPQ